MLTIRVDPTFNGKTLFCKCENIEFPGYLVEDRKILQVHCKWSFSTFYLYLCYEAGI